MWTQTFNAELPRTCFLSRCWFCAESDEFQRSQKLENCQQRACSSRKAKAAAVTPTSAGNHWGKMGIRCWSRIPPGGHQAMAETAGDEEDSQSLKGLWIKTMEVVYKRCLIKKRTQIARNSSSTLLPWYHCSVSPSSFNLFRFCANQRLGLLQSETLPSSVRE